MTLDATKPTDQELVSALPYWIRESREEINNIIEDTTQLTVTELTIQTGETALEVGTDLTDTDMEVVLVSSSDPVVIEQIIKGVQGQLKIFIFQGNNVSFRDGPKSGGNLYLNHLPAMTTFDAEQDDVIALLNIGGDGSSEYGYWKELWRKLSVK